MLVVVADLFIVVASFMEYIQFAVQSLSTLNPKILRVLRVFRAVRAVRALRVLRTISFLKNLQVMVRPAIGVTRFLPVPAPFTCPPSALSTTLSRQVIVSTLLNSIPAMGSIILLLFLVSCEINKAAIVELSPAMWVLTATCVLFLRATADVFAIMGVRMFCETLPSKFGSMYTASFTLFQLITLDDWFELYDNIRAAEASNGVHDGVHPVFLYFFVFIVTENFIFVNLFTAVIVNNLEIHQQKQLGTGTLTSRGAGDDAGGGGSRNDASAHRPDTSAPIKVRAYRHAIRNR